LSWIRAEQDSIMKTQRFDCKLGDQVLRRVGNKTFKGIITGIEKENAHKLLLDIEVRWSDGKTAQISPFDRDLIICKRYGGCLLCRRAGSRLEWRE